MTVADGDLVAALDNGWVGYDLLDAGLGVGGAAAEPTAGVGAQMGDDADLIVRAGAHVNVAGAGDDGDGGGAACVEGFVEVVVGCKG